VLFSREGKREGQALGYSPCMQPVHVDDGAHLNNRIADVEIVGATGSKPVGPSGRCSGDVWGDGVSGKSKTPRAHRYAVPVASQKLLRDMCGPAHAHLQLLERAFADDGVPVDSQSQGSEIIVTGDGDGARLAADALQAFGKPHCQWRGAFDGGTGSTIRLHGQPCGWRQRRATQSWASGSQ